MSERGVNDAIVGNVEDKFLRVDSGGPIFLRQQAGVGCVVELKDELQIFVVSDAGENRVVVGRILCRE